MKKQQKEALVATMKHMSTEKLEAMHDTFVKWDENHDRVKASYFWTPPTSAGGRRSDEKWKTWSDKVEIGDVKISYWSDCTCSCRYYYWDDGLAIRGMDVESFTFGDIRKLDAAIQEILGARKAKAEKRKVEDFPAVGVRMVG